MAKQPANAAAKAAEAPTTTTVAGAPATVPAVALTNFTFFSDGGAASRHVDKGEVLDWPADDFDRACRSGLVKPPPEAK